MRRTNPDRTIIGGCETNVAVDVAQYGIESYLVSVLPNNSEDIVNILKNYGVNTSYLRFGGGNIGTYTIDWKDGRRICSYDRKNSCFAQSTLSFDWEQILQGADILHLSGITPALSKKSCEACFAAVKKAQELNVKVSIDINYRSALWSEEKASQTLRDLCRYADIIFINEDEARLLGFDASGETLMDKGLFNKMANYLKEGYKAEVITTAARIPLPNGGLGVQSIIWHSGKIYQSSIYPIVEMIDKSGAGDAYAAMVLYGILQGLSMQEVVELASATACLKHKYPGDFNQAPLEDIKSTLKLI